MMTIDPVKHASQVDSVNAKIMARRRPAHELRGLS
jgi:hypothetical protein